MTSILTITGSDNSGWSGLQQDLRIITEMGCHALTAATCIVNQNEKKIKDIYMFETDIVTKQVRDVVSSFHPKAVKVGLINNVDAVYSLSKEIVGCSSIVIAPGLVSSSNDAMVDSHTVEAINRYLVPMATLLVIRQTDAQMMLGVKIVTEEDMVRAANSFLGMGAKYVLIRGAKTSHGRVTALLKGNGHQQFFSSYNIEGWQRHGVGGALSTAITVRLGMGDDVPTAIRNAHEYVHSRIVYSVKDTDRKMRPADIYNEFMNLLSDNYRDAHDVRFYAERLNITTRYLSQITNDIVQKAPKQIIADYLLHEAKQTLENSRLSVKEIADTLGFTNVALFCKFFKQQQGQTPSEYRLSVESLS